MLKVTETGPYRGPVSPVEERNFQMLRNLLKKGSKDF